MFARWSACVFLARLYLAAVPHSKGFRHFLSPLPSWCKFHTQKEQKKRAKMPVFLNSSAILEFLTCSTGDNLERELLPSIGKRKQGWRSVWFLAFLHIYPSYFWHGSCWVKCTASWADTSICWAVMKGEDSLNKDPTVLAVVAILQLWVSSSLHWQRQNHKNTRLVVNIFLFSSAKSLKHLTDGQITLSSELLMQDQVPRGNSVEYFSWLLLMLDWGYAGHFC